MLESYKDSQSIMYKMLVNSINKKRISHAYLIETNYNSFGFDFALSIAKFLLCPENKTNNKNCVNCTQCRRIDENSFSEIKILKSETLQIKKEQINELQKEFSLKSVESRRKVYIIEEAEKLNDSSSAALLKFLEEPEENIIAILVVPNKNLLLNTIISRCQIISMKKDHKKSENIIEELCDFLSIKEQLKNDFITDETNQLKQTKVFEFLKRLEEKGKETLLFLNKDLGKNFTTKEDYLYLFNLSIIIYKKAIEFKLKKQAEIDEIIEYISNKNSLNVLCEKLDLLLIYKEKIKMNLNLNMMMDKFILDMEDLK